MVFLRLGGVFDLLASLDGLMTHALVLNSLDCLNRRGNGGACRQSGKRRLRMSEPPAAGKPRNDDIAMLIARSYPAIRRMAAARARASGMRLDATSLANDAVCRLLKSTSVPTSDEHLQAMVWKSIQWIVVDRVRSEHARKDREQGHSVPEASQNVPLEMVSPGLTELNANYPRQAEVVILSSAGELTFEQIARALGISVRTVQRDYEFGLAFLSSACGEADRQDGGK